MQSGGSRPVRRFSVVVPAFNAAPYIVAALDSVALQAYPDREVIVVDDGSTDDTASRVTAWVAAHPDIPVKLVRQPNKGIGGSRNSGIRNATGTFVAFLDADDTWSPQKLERVDKFLRENPGVDLVCHHEWLDQGNGALRRLSHGPHTTYEDLLFGGASISTSAVVVRRALLEQAGGFSEDLSFNAVEDYDLWLRLARSGVRIAYLPEVLGTYRVHGQGITANIDLHLQHTMNVLQSHFDTLSEPSKYQTRIRARRAAAVRDAGRAYMRTGDRAAARRLFRASLAARPFQWQAWAFMLLNEAGVRR